MYGKPIKSAASSAQHTDPSGFAYLKRDLVRLVGILVYEDADMQNRIRLCDGIPVIMNLCVVDERNPREWQSVKTGPLGLRVHSVARARFIYFAKYAEWEYRKPEGGRCH